MTVEETAPGRYTVTHDDSGAVMWEGEAASTDAAYAAAERARTRARGAGGATRSWARPNAFCAAVG